MGSSKKSKTFEMEASQSSHSIGSFSAKNGPRRRSDYNAVPTLENESHVTARRKSVSIRELAEFARAKSTESHKSMDKDGSPSLSSGISIHDKIRLEALHQETFQKFHLLLCLMRNSYHLVIG